MPISHTPASRIPAYLFGSIFVAFGLNAMLNPQSALSFFELPYPLLTDQKTLVDALLIVYGVRDIFMGVAFFATAFFGSTRALGWIMVAGAGCAGVDGWVCRTIAGVGEWSHWGYAPVVGAVGAVLAAGL